MRFLELGGHLMCTTNFEEDDIDVIPANQVEDFAEGQQISFVHALFPQFMRLDIVS